MQRLLMRMVRLMQHPPSPRRVVFVLAVVALCLALAGVELLGLWPEALRVNRLRP